MIIKSYEKKHYFRSEQGADIFDYVARKRNISIEFCLFDNKVKFYKLDTNLMKKRMYNNWINIPKGAGRYRDENDRINRWDELGILG